MLQNKIGFIDFRTVYGENPLSCPHSFESNLCKIRLDWDRFFQLNRVNLEYYKNILNNKYNFQKL